jgi:predicted dithiol-disulfide oxidoreductase (DUF899 family)
MTFGRLQDEPAEYTKRRDELREAEIALRDECERVAELRRMLPLDHVIEDQDFAAVSDGQSVPVKLSELFEDPDKPLVLMQFMYGKAQTTPCPMCTMWADGYDGVVPHLEQRINFAVLVAGDPVSFDAYRRERGWRNLRVVSAANSDLKRRLGFEGDDGSQLPGVSVFVRRPDGVLVHAYSQSALFGEVGGRGMDLLSPVWNFFDLTPSGRGEFMPSTSYTA